MRINRSEAHPNWVATPSDKLRALRASEFRNVLPATRVIKWVVWTVVGIIAAFEVAKFAGIV